MSREPDPEALLAELSDDTASDVDEEPTEAELLARRTKAGSAGVIATPVETMRATRRRRAAYRGIESLRVDYQAKQRVAAEAKLSHAREKEKLAAMAAQAAAARERLLVASPGAGGAAAQEEARAHMATVAERMRLQRELVAREERVQLEAEKACDDAELLVHKARVDERRLAAEKRTEAAEERAAAKGRARNELKAVKRLGRRAEERARQAAAAQAEEDARQELEVSQALEANKRARARIGDSRKARKQARKQAVQRLAAAKDHRTAAVLELKANTEVAMAQLKGANERNANRQRREAKREQAEFEDIRGEGGNPYQVFRRRKLEAKARANKAKHTKRIEEAGMEIGRRMVIENERNRKREAEERKDKLYAEQYVKALGRQANEHRDAEYLRARTKNGTDLVDPTGRVHRIEPSQVTRIKDNSFGLGRSEVMPADTRLDLVDRVKNKSKKNQRVEADPRFVPKERRRTTEEAASVGEQQAADKELDQEEGAMPGADVDLDLDASATASMEDDDSTTAPNQGQGQAQGRTKKYPVPQLSKLQQQRWEARKAKMREPNIQKQTALGREFTGRPFLPKPETITFTDFDVGRDMVQRITLTNVSFTFNHFKILDLPDEIKDFFDISYAKPGRMSAGMSCSVTIRFMPKIARDIRAELPLLAQTGRFSIPLICTTKKIVPSVNTDEIVFENVVMGETETFGLRVTNDGALPADFVVLRQSDLDAEAEALPAAPTATTDDMPPSTTLGTASTASAAAPPPPMSDELLGTEDQLLALAASVGTAATEYPEGLGPIQFQPGWRCEPYASVTVPVTFAPLSPGAFGEELVLRFDAPEVPDIRVTLVATSIKVPIYVRDPVMDLRCTVYDKLYRAPLVLHNRGNIALKFQTAVPRELRDVVSFHPDMGFAQAADRDGTPGTFVVHVKFRPTRGLLERCGRHALVDQGVLAVPVQVLVPDQVLPVYFTLRAQITTSDIHFSVPALEFGACYTTQSVRMPLTVSTDSALPQKIAFVKLPPELEVQPNDGFASLLPRDTRTFDVCFKPSSAVDHVRNLIVRTSLNREFTLPIRGQGVEPPLRLSHTRINFAATSFGDHTRQSVFVTNNAKHDVCFEFAVPAPEYSQIRVTPLVGRIEPGKALRVQVEFSPNQRALRMTPAASAASLALSGGGGSEGEGEGEGDGSDAEVDAQPSLGSDTNKSDDSDAEPDQDPDNQDPNTPQDPDDQPQDDQQDDLQFLFNDDHPLPPGCELFVSDTIGRDELDKRGCAVDGDDLAEQAPEPWSLHGKWLVPMFVQGAAQPFFLQVNTTVVKRELVAETQRVSFGQVAVGEAEVYPLRVRNMSAVDSDIVMSGLTSIGPFSVLNAVRPLAANGGSQKLLIEFRPERQLKFCETMLLESNTGRVSVVIVGEGVSPTLSVEPPDGRINLGHVVAREQCSATFTLHNYSVFPLTYAVKPTHRLPTNYNQREVFSCVPPEASIAAGGSQVVTVFFQPDHERPVPYSATFLVDVPNQAVEHRITVTGRCWARQLYVHPTLLSDEPPAQSPELVEDVFDLPSHLLVSDGEEEEAPEDSEGEGEGDGEGQPKRRITLTFPKPELGPDGTLGTYDKSITIGCAQRTDNSGSGSWELELTGEDARCFSASKSRGADSAGASTEVVFTFTPPPPQQTAGLFVGKWVEVIATVSLKGGYCPPGQPESTSMEVALRGYVTI